MELRTLELAETWALLISIVSSISTVFFFSYFSGVVVSLPPGRFFSIAMSLVLRAAIFNSLSSTVSSRRNFSHGIFANLCRTTLVRVPDSDVPRHNKWFTVLKAIPHLSQTNAFHAAHGSVTQGRKIVGSWQLWEVVSVIDWTGCQARSGIQQSVFCAVQACDHESPLGWW